VERRIGNLYVCPVINTMGPVTDPRHKDLLNNWDGVDAMLAKIFDPAYRSRVMDSAGRGAVFSWFFISWSGFRTNPVHRDFGYFNVYDHYHDKWGAAMRRYGDDMYWMYNHPAASGIGNEWGLDWFENAHYLEILMRYIDKRGYFPSVVEVVTEANDTSHFLENYFPFDLGNRNSVDVNWEAKNADGNPMWKVIDWRSATHEWATYRPADGDYQSRGEMRRNIGRLLDIKTIVYEFKEYEFERAFHACLEGRDQMISGYEHDFRDRADVIQEKFLQPLERIAQRYKEVRWYYKNSRDGFNLLQGRSEELPAVSFRLSHDRRGNVLIRSDAPVFGTAPFAFFVNGDRYQHVTPLRIGQTCWLIYKEGVQPDMELVVAANNPSGVASIARFQPDIFRPRPKDAS
jgi:hypothetical protein